MSNSQIGFTGLNSGLCTTTNGSGCSSDINTSVPSTAKVVGSTGRQFLTVQIWDTIGCAEDNIVRIYNMDDCVFKDGKYYWSTINGNTSEPGVGAGWTAGDTLCNILRANADRVEDVYREQPKLGAYHYASDVIDNPLTTNFVSFTTKTYTAADLTSMGKLAGHNAVVVRLDVSSRVVVDDTALPETGYNTQILVGDELLQSVHAIAQPLTGIANQDKDSKSVQRVIQLDANGGISVKFQKLVSSLTGVQDASVSNATIQVLGFKKVTWSNT